MKGTETILVPQRKVVPAPRFREGSDYYLIWKKGHMKPVRRDTLVRNLSRSLRKPQRLVGFDLDVLIHPKHRSNRGRCHADPVAREQGKVLLVPGA